MSQVSREKPVLTYNSGDSNSTSFQQRFVVLSIHLTISINEGNCLT